MVGLLDTSAFVAVEQLRADVSALPSEVAVPVIALAELRVGVLMATDLEARSRRLATLEFASLLDPIEVTSDVALRWAEIGAYLREAGMSVPINDMWIAAIAIANDMSVVTQDSDFDKIKGLRVVKI